METFLQRAHLFVLFVFFVVLLLPAQEPPMLVVRESRLRTNVVLTLTTTIEEVKGIRVDGTSLATKTNLLFRAATNLWEQTL